MMLLDLLRRPDLLRLILGLEGFNGCLEPESRSGGKIVRGIRREDSLAVLFAAFAKRRRKEVKGWKYESKYRLAVRDKIREKPGSVRQSLEGHSNKAVSSQRGRNRNERLNE